VDVGSGVLPRVNRPSERRAPSLARRERLLERDEDESVTELMMVALRLGLVVDARFRAPPPLVAAEAVLGRCESAK
jgi:hypothetical protein